MDKQKMDMEYCEIKEFMEKLYHYYYTERDYKKVIDMVSEDGICIGLGVDEIGKDRESSIRFIKKQMEDVSVPIPYVVNNYLQKNCGEHVWTSCAEIELKVLAGDWGIVRYLIRLSASICKCDGQWKFSSIHVSEAGVYDHDKNPLCFNTKLTSKKDIKPVDQRQLGMILDQLVPGGLVSRRIGDNYPIVISNKQFLKMIGYTYFKDYMEDQAGSYINSIHPDDVDKYIYNARFIESTDKQCECEYRLRCRNGKYLWIHDIGRRAVSVDGETLIVSVITDISEQIEIRKRLELENEIDFLTKIYNRKGAKQRYLNWPNSYKCSAFFVIDLDNFKQVNDFYGHVKGDEVLQYTARILSESIGEKGLVCRLGGDEFAIFIPNYDNVKNVQILMKEISNRYRMFTTQKCPKANSTMSIGGIYSTQETSLTIKYEKADANLYRVKNSDKGNILLTELEE